jgi:hypothetical protein
MQMMSIAAAVLTVSFWDVQLPSPEAWAQADGATIRLDPAEFTNLPRFVLLELQRRGCAVPQPFTGSGHQNVIRGSFHRSGQIDWAVLCSRARTSSILVFSNAGAGPTEELARRPDADYLQTIGGNRIGFSRAISGASAGDIRHHHQQHGGTKPPTLAHIGIDYAFVGKGSVVWYWYRGKWLELTGAD